MLVIDEKAEQRLLKLLDRYKAGESHGRAVHVRITQYGVLPLPLSELIPLTQTAVADPSLQIFVLRDGDIVLVADQISTREARAYNRVLAQHLGLPENEPLTQFFEVEHSWNYLVYLVDEKLQRIVAEAQKAESEREAAEKDRLRKIILTEEAAPELARTLSRRREQHVRPVVMIIEDDVFSRRLVEGVLRQTCDLVSLGDGRDVAKQYVVAAPSAVFLDIDLPDVSGHDLLRRIIEIDPDAYVVMLSGNGDRNNVSRAIQNGAKGFVGKPFTKDRLEKYIGRSPLIKPAKGA